jgi:septum formation protein
MKLPCKSLILASQSPARKMLLESLGVAVITSPTHCDESHNIEDYRIATREIALRKLYHFIRSHHDIEFPVIAADTMIKVGSSILGKPINRSDAKAQLSLLSGSVHSVCSGYAIFLPYKKRIYSGFDEAFVEFHPLTHTDIENYLDSEEYVGAAASYRIQGKGNELISSIKGDITTIVGLPIMVISAILTEPENFNYQEYPPQGEK